MSIKNLQITNVGIFNKTRFDFDPHINVFVGPNNCGKTTALLTLADIAVNPFTFPAKHVHPKSSIAVDFGVGSKRNVISGPIPIEADSKGPWSGTRLARIERAQQKLGYTTFVPALRIGTDYRSKGPLTNRSRTRAKRQRAIYADMQFEQGSENGAPDLPEIGSSFMRDVEIVQDLVNADYQAYREHKPSIRNTIELIASITSKITEGFPVEFAGVVEDGEGLTPCFETPDGKMPLNVLSQGTQGLLLWLSRFILGYARYYKFPAKFDEKPAVLIIDEIDAHLHPSWQRRILPELSCNFPALQIFCSSHSPLILAGLKAGQIQLLNRDEKGKVCASRNDHDIRGWSADEIYSGFLGIVNPTDEKTNDQVERLAALRSKRDPSPSELSEIETLRKAVGSALLNTPLRKEDAAEMVSALKKSAENFKASKKGKK